MVDPKTEYPPEPYLIRGESRARRVASWHWRVQRAAIAVAHALDEWQSGRPSPASEVLDHAGFRLRPDPLTLIRIPLAVVPGHAPAAESDWVTGPPLVAVEVMIPPERGADLDERVAEYLACGVAAVWVLYPERGTVAVHRPGAEPVTLSGGDTLSGDPELPGFAAAVADFFR